MPIWDDQPRDDERPSARLAAALGRPAPPPLTPEQRADFEARVERADAELERILGLGQTHAA